VMTRLSGVRAVGVKGPKVSIVPEAIITAATAPYGFIGIGFASLVGVGAIAIALTVMRNRRRAALRAQQHDSVRMFDLLDKRGAVYTEAPRESRLDQPTLANPARNVGAGQATPDLCLPR
jgi:hypothetical protein